eukprot:14005843-Alexandrium_andersonii.AAC.1
MRRKFAICVSRAKTVRLRVSTAAWESAAATSVCDHPRRRASGSTGGVALRRACVAEQDQ